MAKPAYGMVPASRNPLDSLLLDSRTLVWTIVFVFLVWANIETPLWSDDYCEAVPVGFTGPFTFAWHDYFTWTGRVFVTAITYAVISTNPLWPAILFDIANAAIFVCLIRHVIGLARHFGLPFAEAPRSPLASAVDIGFVALLLWWLPRDIGEVALWKTGSIDYLWAVTGELWVLRWMLTGNRGNSPWRVLFAFAIATFLETISALVSVWLCAFCVWCWRRQRRGPVGLMLGHVAGCVLLLAAPGNFVRANALPSGPFSDHVAGVIGNLGSLFDVWWIPAMALVALSLMYGGSVREPAGSNAQPDCSGRRGIWDILRAGHGWIFLVLALVYMLILLALPRPTLAARVSFPASIFLICYLAALFFQRPVTNRDNRIGVPVLLVLLACHLAIVVPDLRDLAQIHRGWANDPQFKKGPGTDVTLPPVLLNGRPAYARKDMFFQGPTTDPAYFVNVCTAAAMHVRTVRVR
jgi:Family of unknown function (DUF6056)